jgi:hypothetical protein
MNASKEGYRKQLSSLRRYSAEASIPFWNFFNAMPLAPPGTPAGGHYDPSEAQLRWQAFTSLCFGAKGVLWFLYWCVLSSRPHYSPQQCQHCATVRTEVCLIIHTEYPLVRRGPAVANSSATFSNGGGIIVERGLADGSNRWERGLHYEHARRINSVLKVSVPTYPHLCLCTLSTVCCPLR